MAGNKKPRKARNSDPLKAVRQRAKLRAQVTAREQKKNNLPLSHPLNAYMIEATYGPLERHLAEHEKTGRILVAEGDQAPMFYDGKDWIAIIPAMLHMCFLFDKIAGAKGWPEMPEGLRVYTIGLQIGRPIDADDFAGARKTIDWMKEQMGTLTPIQWKEMFEWAITLDGGELEPGWTYDDRPL